MSQSNHHLAQANVARMKGPLESPVMEGFRKQLAAVNAAADHSQGFVWRLQTAKGDSTEVRAFEDERILFNMSVWSSLEDLQFYVYRSGHSGPYRDRARWFEPLDPPFVLWWIPVGHTPSVDEALEKLTLLDEEGPSEAAFTFQKFFPAN